MEEIIKLETASSCQPALIIKKDLNLWLWAGSELANAVSEILDSVPV